MAQHKIEIQYIADLARIALSAEEAELFGSQLDQVLEHVEELQKLDVSQIEPTAHGAPVFNVFRDDAVEASMPLADVMANAPRKGNDLILVPKIVE